MIIMNNKNKSFTLIELLVVIVIIGILAGVIMISTSSSIDKANFAKAQAFSSTVKNELFFNLVSEWTFDEPQQGNITIDSFSNNHGTVYGATYKTRESGECVSGGCYSFDGVDDYISISQLLIFDSSFTISMWVNPKMSSSRSILIGDYGFANGINVNFEITSGNKLRWYWNASPDISGSRNVKINNFNYIVFLRDKEKNKVYAYIDGILDINYSGSIVDKNPIDRFYIGRDYRTGETAHNGLIDDVRIYNAALSASQIKQNYVAGLNSLLNIGSISKEAYNERINALAYDN
jgi:prepilin-type N-terminal cleavage/methylation domain-containing protein